MLTNIERVREAETRVADLQAKLELLQSGLQRVEAAARVAEDAREPARRIGKVLVVLGVVGVVVLVVRRLRRDDELAESTDDPAVADG